MYTDEVQVETVVEAPRDQVYQFLVNPYQVPLVLPGLIDISDVPELPLKVGDAFNSRYQVAGVVLEGQWTATELDGSSHYTATTNGAADSEWSYELTDQDGGAHVSLTVRYNIPDSILQKAQAPLLRSINKHDGEALMKNLKVVLEVKNQ